MEFAEHIKTGLLASISTIVVYQLIKWLLDIRRFYTLAAKFEKPPGYSCHPIIGHAQHFTNFEDIVTLPMSFTSRYGVVYLGPRTSFFLNDPSLIEECLTHDKCLDKPNYFDFLDQAEGSMFLAKGNIWKIRRKLLNPGFKQSILNFYTGKFIKHDECFAEQLEGKVGHIFDINEIAVKINFRKYFDCAFGLDLDAKCEEYMNALTTSFSLMHARFFSIKSFKFINAICGNGKEFNDCKTTLTRVTHEIVAERLKIIEERTKNGPVEVNDECEELIFIDYILQCIKEEKYDEKNLAAELIVFIYAAIDTGSHMFSFICLCLALHPEIQDKVYEEIVQVTSDRPFHYSDYQHLTYLQMVIKETMRLFPAGSVVHRQASEDVKIGEYIFPKGSILLSNTINVHRSSKYYPNPLTFDPERFAPDSDAVKNRHPFAYSPFSGGKRNCIGERFAMLALASSAVTVFKKFRFETTHKRIENIRIEQKFTLGAVGSFPVRIYSRSS